MFHSIKVLHNVKFSFKHKVFAIICTNVCLLSYRIEKDKDIPNPFITIHSNGFVENVKNIMVVSSCKMQVYKFPFDSQSCTLSLKSIIYPGELSEVSRHLSQICMLCV